MNQSNYLLNVCSALDLKLIKKGTCDLQHGINCSFNYIVYRDLNVCVTWYSIRSKNSVGLFQTCYTFSNLYASFDLSRERTTKGKFKCLSSISIRI